uniref:Transthyretin-like family protein n=1 Tax=Haemonchus contortus TaxID=6289 RepID=A0A7I4YQ81_HAECO
MLFYALIGILVAIPRTESIFGIGNPQSIAVDGELRCNGIPATNIKVELYDKEILFDTKLAEGRTDPNGKFHLEGGKREFTNIDPKLNIYHKCSHAGACYRKVSTVIPDSFITEGKTPQQVFHAGTIDLDENQPGETIDCVD